MFRILSIFLLCFKTYLLLEYPTDCTLQTHLACNIISQEGRCPYFKTKGQKSPSKVTDLEISPDKTSRHAKVTDISSPVIKWSIPRDDSYHLIEGFRLEIYNWGRNGEAYDLKSCHIYNLTGAKWEDADKQLQFVFHYPIPGQYVIQITTLPDPEKSNLNNRESRFINAFTQNHSDDSYLWAPEILVIQNESCSGSVSVEFAPPLDLDFDKFKVYLFDNAHGEVGSQVIELHGQKMIRAHFRDLKESSVYFFMLQPLDSCPIGKCQCYKPGTAILKCCFCMATSSYHLIMSNSCTYMAPSRVNLIETTPLSTESTDGTLDTELPQYVIIIVVLLSVIAVGLSLLILYKIIRKEPKVLIVYDDYNGYEDHYHVQTVKSFCQLLKEHGHCEPIPYALYSNQNIPRKTFHKIIYINSNEIDQHHAHYTYYNSHAPEIYDFIINHNANKICVRFEYSDRDTVIPILSNEYLAFTAETICLPVEMRKLMRKIHFRFNYNDKIDESVEMKELDKNIQLAKRMIDLQSQGRRTSLITNDTIIEYSA